MGKTVWILNHYANHMLYDKGGRHYNISKYLSKNGYNPVIFCANMINGNPTKQSIDSDDLFVCKCAEEINTPFVFVKVSKYNGNGFGRVKNMISFYKNVKTTAKKYALKNGKPDVIIASSVHPLTLVAGIKLARKFGVKCICEVRDLWPESLVAYGHLRKNSLIAKILYLFEKRIYINSDKIVMTWPGGYDYIIDKGWDSEIPQEKVVHISNGVDLESFEYNIKEHVYEDSYLSENSNKKLFIYAGTISQVNNLGVIVDAAKILQERKIENIKILVYGRGNEREALNDRVKDLKLSNIAFPGAVNKEEVPSLLSHAYVTILHNSSTSLDKFGQSQNKFFEYLAIGKPILMTYSVGHSICKEKGCGFEIDHQTSKDIADAIEEISRLDENEYKRFSYNALETASLYDFKILTKTFIDLIEEI